jgi:hypothetical protein
MKLPLFCKLLARALFLGFFALTAKSQATAIKIYDDSLSVIASPALSSNAVIAARLGIWNGTTFSPALTGVSGYFDNDLKELSTSISASDNSLVGINAGQSFALAIYNLSSTSNYSSVVAQAILTDTSWIMPALTFGLSETVLPMTSSTVATVGSYSWNGGNQNITLALIPEPSSASLLALGLAGLLGIRRNYKNKF